MKRDDQQLDRLLSGGRMSRPEKERRLQALLRTVGENAEPRRARGWLRFVWAVPALAMILVLPLLIHNRGHQAVYRAKGSVAAPAVEVSCAGGCRPGATLIYRVDGLREPAYLAAYAVGADGTRIWHFPSESGELPPVLPGAGPQLVQRGIHIDREPPDGQYTLHWLLVRHPIARGEVLSIEAAGEAAGGSLRIGAGIQILEVLP